MKFDFEEDINIDLTPLIDVIFMLLIFFIMTTTFSKPVIDIVLPASETSGAADKKNTELIIAVDEKGKMFYGEAEIDGEALTMLLREKPEELLNLHMDEKAPFESFVAIVDIAKKERGGQFVISTKSDEKR